MPGREAFNSVAGANAFDVSELREVLPFTAKANARVKTLAAAIGYLSGTKKVNLGMYSESDGTVRTLLPGCQGSTTAIPDFGERCQLTQVTFPLEAYTPSENFTNWISLGGLWLTADIRGMNP